jgi:hypothetical protein
MCQQPNVKHHMCVIVGTLCRELHIVPVAVLPGIENAQEPHDLDLYRWVPFYREVTTVDPEENMFIISLPAENISYSFYHTSQVSFLFLLLRQIELKFFYTSFKLSVWEGKWEKLTNTFPV